MKRLLLCGLVLLLASPVWASEEIGRQEDTANADGQVLMPAGCVRQDTIASSTSADGDYQNIKCNNIGRIYTSTTIDAALPAGTNGIGKLTANSGVIIGDVNVVGSLPAGANALGTVGITSLIPGTGATSLGKAEDAVHVSGDTGVPALCVRHDTSTTGLGIDGDYANCGLNSLGELYTVSNTELPAAAVLADNTANPTVPGVAAFMMCFDGTTWDRCLPGLSDTDDDSVAFSQLTSIVIGQNYISDGASWIRRRIYLEDVASAGAEQLSLAGFVRQDTPAGSTTTDGDYTYGKTDSVGRIWINCGAGCATNTQYAEDSAHVSTDTVTLAGVVQQSADAALSSDGDRSLLQVDASGFLKVNIKAGAGSGGTALADDAVFTGGTTNITPMGALYDTTPPAATDGSVGVPRMNSARQLYVEVVAGAGTTQFAEDAASGNGDLGTLALARRTATPANTSGADLDYEVLQMSAGRLWVSATIDTAIPSGANVIGAVTITGTPPGTAVEDAAEVPGQTGMLILSVRRDVMATSSNTDGDTSTINTDAFGRTWVTGTYLEDVAETAGGQLTMAGTVRRDVAASSAGTTGDNSTANTDGLGLLWARFLDPCSGVAKVAVPINIATATTTQLVAASASNFVYVCSLNIGPTAAAQNVALIEDDTSACASPTAGLAGGVTAASGWNILAGGGLNLGSGISFVAKTAATNRYVCLISSAATQTSGVLTYALAP